MVYFLESVNNDEYHHDIHDDWNYFLFELTFDKLIKIIHNLYKQYFYFVKTDINDIYRVTRLKIVCFVASSTKIYI